MTAEFQSNATTTTTTVATTNFSTSLDPDTTLHNFTVEDVMNVHFYYGVMINRSITPIWYLIGLVGNTISAVVWLQSRMRKNSSSAIYLAALSINDNLVLMLHFPQELMYAWYIGVLDVPVLCQSYAILFLAAQYLAPFLVLSFSLDRFIAICYPFRKYKFCNTSAAVKMVLLNIFVSLAFSSIQGYFWTIDEDQKCMVREDTTDETNGTSLWLKWTTISESFVFLFIPSLNTLLNILVIHEIWKISKRTSINTTSSKPSISAQSSQSSQLPQQHKRSSFTLAVNGRRKTSQQQLQPFVNANNNKNGHYLQQPQQQHHHLLVRQSAAGSWSASGVGGASNCSSACPPTTGSAAATNVMLLSVSFYVIFTTLPPAIIYSVENRFPDGPLINMSHEMIRSDPVWQRNLTYLYLKIIIYELSLSHYACNFFLFAFTGRKFRAAVSSTLRCRFWRSESDETNSGYLGGGGGGGGGGEGSGGWFVGNQDNASYHHQQQLHLPPVRRKTTELNAIVSSSNDAV